MIAALVVAAGFLWKGSGVPAVADDPATRDAVDEVIERRGLDLPTEPPPNGGAWRPPGGKQQFAPVPASQVDDYVANQRAQLQWAAKAFDWCADAYASTGKPGFAARIPTLRAYANACRTYAGWPADKLAKADWAYTSIKALATRVGALDVDDLQVIKNDVPPPNPPRGEKKNFWESPGGKLIGSILDIAVDAAGTAIKNSGKK